MLTAPTGVFCRWLSRWVLLLAVVITAYFPFQKVCQIPTLDAELKSARDFATVAYTEPIKAAVAQKLESAKSLYQAGLLLVAVLWGLILAKKDENRLLLTDIPEFVMFLLANIWLGASWYCYSKYLDAMADVHSRDAKYVEAAELIIMDFRSPLINHYYLVQQQLWLWGAAIGILTLLSAHLLKERPT